MLVYYINKVCMLLKNDHAYKSATQQQPHNSNTVRHIKNTQFVVACENVIFLFS